jgi:signal transduction histidine kinase
VSLLTYLSQRLFILALVLSVGLFYIVYILYQWGLDDSTEYYLQQDMLWAKELIDAEQDLPNNTELKQFYLSDTSLPKAYKDLIQPQGYVQSFFLEDEYYYHYGLHEIRENNHSITVIHKFLVDSHAEGMSLVQISMVASLLLIAVMLLGAFLIYQRIARSMQLLLMAVSVEQKDNANELIEVAKSDFVEIENIVHALQTAINDLEDKNAQERLFTQALSHELRTPMATIQVALELLLKKNLDDNIREKLGIIFSSNQQMQTLSHDLLSLWSSTKLDEINTDKRKVEINKKTKISNIIQEKMNLKTELAQVVNDLDNAFSCKQRFIINTIDSSLADKKIGKLEVLVHRPHLRLLLNNLCKNAIVHSDGDINIMMSDDEIKITNPKSDKSIDPLVAGSGIGLILAARAAELLGWRLVVKDTPNQYQVLLKR